MGQIRKRGGVWWIRWYRDGRRFEESAKSDKWETARDLLRQREGDVANGVPVSTRMARLKFDDAAKDLENEYDVNKRKSLDHLKRRIKLHLGPFFNGRRMTAIRTADVNAYVKERQKEGAKPASINRELAILKRAYTLAIRGGKLLPAHRPYIAMLQEHNVRTGFFEAEQFEAVKKQLSEPLQAIAEFAYLTGWRVRSEILSLEWRHVDLDAGTVSLDPGATKNGDGRTIYMTTAIRTLLENQKAIRDRLKEQGTIVRAVFHRNGKPVKDFYGAWRSACQEAAVPGRYLHDFRRTAIRNWVRLGIPERVAMKMSGHRTRSVFDRYNVVSPGDLRAAAASLDEAGQLRDCQPEGGKSQQKRAQ